MQPSRPYLFLTIALILSSWGWPSQAQPGSDLRAKTPAIEGPAARLTVSLPGLAASGCENDLIVNGSFEDPAIRDRSYSHLQQLRGWRLSQGSRFEIQRNIMGPAADGQQYLELASNAPTTIYQPVQLQPGTDYVLHLAYSPRPWYADNTVEILLDGRTIGTLTGSGRGQPQTSWKEHTFRLRGDGRPVRLEIADRSQPDAGGGYIDAVRLCEAPPPPRCRENMVSNGSFEEPRISDGYKHLQKVPGWRLVEGPSLELQRNIFGPAADGQQYMEMASSAPVGAAQTVATSPGTEYLLQLAYSARPAYRDNTVELRFDGQTVAVLRGDGGGVPAVDWQEHRFVVRSSGHQSVIEILDRSAVDAGGGFIDDVRLCPALSASSR